MSKVVSVTAPPLAPGCRAVRAPTPLRLQFACGWVVAGLLNLALDVLPGEGRTLGGVHGLLAHVVDFGRHVGFGLLSLALVWLFQHWLPNLALLGWAAFALLSLSFGAWVLPTDLDGLAERWSEAWGMPTELASAL